MNTKNIFLFLIASLLTACSGSVGTIEEERNELPPIFPDYVNCTIPSNIAPLNFQLTIPYEEAYVRFSTPDETWDIKAGKGQFTIPSSRWKKLLESNVGKEITVKVFVKTAGQWVGYTPFTYFVAAEPVDPYLVYRLIEPGYELWYQMGIYQRNLEGYKQSPVMENKLSNGNCMNCHSFCMQDPDKMLFHMRGAIACTMLVDDGKVEKLNTKTEQTMSPLVYPSWHPSGRYLAFSVNDTKQAFHMNHPNRIEVYDLKSDVVVYDTENHEIISSRLLYGTEAFETFPTFSPDGRTMYFCSAQYVEEMPFDFEDVHYSLCAISFDPETRSFGTQVDTLYQAQAEGRSVSFPRVSPDGKFLMFTLSDYGGFSIWHKDADLYLMNLSTGEYFPMERANSEDVDSYHSWSSNSRWVVFSSRRIDGLYTRPHIAYISENGEVGKAFLLPQKEVDFYHRFMYSYNVPEFVKGKVKDNRRAIKDKAWNDKGIDLKFVRRSSKL